MMEVCARKLQKDFIRKRAETNVFTAVAECDLTLPAGTLTVIKGRSGGGKSTLLNMLSGILAPTSGTVTYDGRDLYAMGDTALSAFRNQQIGMIPQGKTAIASLTVMENILLPLTLYKETDEETARELMECLAIDGLAGAMPEELSGGELRRMAIARALIRRPSVIFADEPTGDLDDENTKIVLDMLKRLTRDGITVLMVTHDGEAEAYADRLYRMDAGQLRENGR